MERVVFGLDPVRRPPTGRGGLHGHVDDEHEVRDAARHGKLVGLRDGVDPEPACDALVDERRLEEPVADHPVAAHQRRPHDLG